jgi:hypothetical protein
VVMFCFYKQSSNHYYRSAQAAITYTRRHAERARSFANTLKEEKKRKTNKKYSGCKRFFSLFLVPVCIMHRVRAHTYGVECNKFFSSLSSPFFQHIHTSKKKKKKKKKEKPVSFVHPHTPPLLFPFS